MTNQDRPRIFSHITRTRFLHLEDSLEIGKIRFFVGEYQKGQGAQATAYHFLDADDARPLCADLSWSKPTDFVDYKGSANGQQPVSRVLKIKGPKDGKYWLQVDNGPGQIIGAGAVKPAGDPEASVSIALTTWEARKLALACLEYMQAYRVAALVGAGLAPAPLGDKSRTATADICPQKPEPLLGPRSADPADDVEALFGPQPAAARVDPPAPRPQKADEIKDDPPTFYALANDAIQAGLLATVQELIRAPGSWREKTARLQQAMAA